MKILVISDTHGKLNKVYDIFEKLKDIDLIIHCGDYVRDGEILEETLEVPVVRVMGNCDSSGGKYEEIVETPYGDILVVHGHKENVNYDLMNLLYLAQEKDCTCVCFGHTHIPLYEEYQGIHMINPGSLTFPRDGTNGSYAVIHSDEDDFYGAIVFYDTVCGNDKGKKPKGGFIRNMINYSDRF